MNKRLHALQERKKALVADSEKLLAQIDAEDRDFTDDETARFDANAKELEEVKSKIDREESLSAYATTTAAGATFDEPSKTTRIGNVKEAFEDDPNKGFKTEREFLTGVMAASLHGHTEDSRLKHLSAKKYNFLATAGSDEAGTYSDPYGGFLVPTGFSPNLLTVGSDDDPTAGRTTTMPMASPKVDIPARVDKDHSDSVTGGFQVYRRSETETVTAKRAEFEQVTINSYPLMGLSYASNELLSDSAISFVTLIEQSYREEFASRILYEKLYGTGVGQMEGILNSPALVSVNKETGQDADSILYENVIKMRARCWRYQDAIWLYNQDCLPQLMQMVMTIGTSGVPVWQTSAREGEPDMLLGRPAYPTEYCPTVGDKGDIVLGNWSQYIEGTYQPMESASSMHVRFSNNEETFKFTMRNDGKCWWRSALTPKKSSDTLSPFVTLNARA